MLTSTAIKKEVIKLNRTFDMIMRNLRNEVNRIVKESEDRLSMIHVQDKMISRLNDRIKELEKGGEKDYDPAP